MLRFSGNTITGFVNNNLILSASDSIFAEGMAGLVSGSKDKTSNIALFDNLMIKPVKGIKPTPAVFSEEIKPVYAPAVKNDY
jgi:galactosylceramidase